MKKLKIMSAILAVIMTFGLCACGKDGGNTPSDNPTTSATTVAPTDTATTTAAAAANEFITTGKSIKITIPKLENTVKIDKAKFESSVVPDGKFDSFNSTITVEGNDRKFNIIIKDGSLMGKTSLEVAEKLNKGEENDDKKYNACEIAGFKGVLKVNTYSGNSKTQHIYYLDVPCGDETYVVNFRLEELYNDDTSEMKNIEEAVLKSIKVEKNN